MPRADDLRLNDHLCRTMLYGKGKAKKTWWLLLCAKMGFHVILLDGDDGSHIIRQAVASGSLTKDDLTRIHVVKLMQREDGKPVFPEFLAKFLKPSNWFIWDEDAREEVVGMRDPAHGHFFFEAGKLNSNYIVGVDSWTSLSEGTRFQYALENKLDLSDAKKTEWDGFGYEGNYLNWVLARLHALPCHVFVIAHSTVYEKWDRRDKKNPKLLEQHEQPISCSGPHAKKLAKHFSDVLFFEKHDNGLVFISTDGGKDRDGGSRLLPPQRVEWKELPPKVLLEALGAQFDPNLPTVGAQYFRPGEEIPGRAMLVKSSASSASASSPPKTTESGPSSPPVIGSPMRLKERIRLGAQG